MFFRDGTDNNINVHCTWTPGTALYGDVPEITIDVLSWSVSEERGVLVKVGLEEVVGIWGELEEVVGMGELGSRATGAEGLDSSPTLSYLLLAPPSTVARFERFQQRNPVHRFNCSNMQKKHEHEY